MAGKRDYMARLRQVSDHDLPRFREHFLEPAEAFDAARMGDALLFPLEMTWFYGEPIWHDMSAEQQRMLNRLSFCQSYFSTAVAEAATNVLNYQSALETFISGDDDAAIYMAREALEETVHIQTFLIIVRKVLAHYGMTLDDLRAANPSLRMAWQFTRMHSLLGWLRRDFRFYYFTRFALNVNQKTVERCAINEPGIDPHVRAILKNHAIDEARHMQMSRETGRRAVASMGCVSRNLACLAYARFAAGIYIGRHGRDSRQRRATRVRTLMLCGVSAERAREAYASWHRRIAQPEDPPLVRAGRRYYLRQNLSYIDVLPVGEKMKRTMRRIIERAYADVSRPADNGGAPTLDLPDLQRAD